MKKFYCLIILISFPAFCFGQSSTAEALEKLDDIVANRQEITQSRLEQISKTMSQLARTKSVEQKYKLTEQIYNDYRAFNVDSAEVYARKQLSLAKQLDNSKYISHAVLTLAEVYAIEGMYLEALKLADSVDKRTLNSNDDLLFYFHVYRMLYGFMADYSQKNVFHENYAQKRDAYRDSLLSYQVKGSYSYDISKSEMLLDKGDYKEVLKLLLPWTKKENDLGMMRYLGYTLSLAYQQAGDSESEEYYLTLSAISDLKSAVKEYVSLFELAKLLFKKGDLERAYLYMKCSMDDAAYCNARLRTVEISEIYPIIEKTYQENLKKKSRQRTIAFTFVCLLAFSLMVLLFYLNKQKNKLSLYKQNLIDLNKALKQSNTQLISSNVSLVEANRIKESSLSRYMELCSFYIDRMNEYQHSLIKIASKEKVEDLYKALRSSAFIEKELKDFYLNFDSTFLELFPTFVEEFNNMLVPEGRIYPKEKGQLNVELRIFALIRLGISDSAKIAKFLRYSVTTIYNYRVKVRNAAQGDRNMLEREIMTIAQPNNLL
jgi:hypothetical protein